VVLREPGEVLGGVLEPAQSRLDKVLLVHNLLCNHLAIHLNVREDANMSQTVRAAVKVSGEDGARTDS
jgi:hypothetical protein